MTWAVLLAILLGVVHLGSPATAAASTTGLYYTASTTYALNTGAARLDVEIVITVKNQKPNSGGSTYYYDSTYAYLENEATGIKVKADSGSSSIARSEAGIGFDLYSIKFGSAVFYGKTRILTVTYQLPGAAPRSGEVTRVGRAYSFFCVASNGFDGGSARIRVPASFSFTHLAVGGAFTSSTADGMTTYQTGAMAKALDFWACFGGSDLAAYAGTTVSSPSGRQINIQSWPEDTTWQGEVKGQISSAVVDLERLIGRGLPGTGPITVREVSSASLGNYAASFDADQSTAYISEDIHPGSVAHELAHGWFNGALFEPRWMSEGMAGWAESVVSKTSCNDPGAPAGNAQLSQWKFVGPRATEAEIAAVQYQYAASCYVMTTLAGRAGQDRMRTVLAALMDRTSAYQTKDSSRPGHSGPTTWQDFLDAIDELGLAPGNPTNLDYAQEVMARYGAADTIRLVDRSQARAKYHAVLQVMGDWDLPEVILRAMEEWRFSTAVVVLTSAENVQKTAAEAARLLPEANILTGALKTQLEGAETPSDLAAAEAAAADVKAAAELVAGAKRRLAQPRTDVVRLGLTGSDLSATLAQAVAAVANADVAAARAKVAEIDKILGDEAAAAQVMAAAKDRVDAPRDILASVGLVGHDLGASVATGVAAVVALDLETAKATAASIDAALDDASGQGILRLIVVIVLLALAALAVLLVRRRRAGTRLAPAAAGTSALPAVAPSAPPEGSPPSASTADPDSGLAGRPSAEDRLSG